MKAVPAILVCLASFLACAPVAAGPSFSTGGSCATNGASRVPAGARQVLLSNPSKIHLAATLYREIDKPNFKYRDADGAERLSAFPYHYQVFIPPHGIGPIGCTRIFIAGGEAAQTFVLQKTDYFLAAPSDNTEEARLSVGFIPGADGASHLLNLHATKTVHVAFDRAGRPMRLDISPQAVSAAAVGGREDLGGREELGGHENLGGGAENGHSRHLHLTDVHF